MWLQVVFFIICNDIDSIFRLKLIRTCITAWFIYDVSIYRHRRTLPVKLNKNAQKPKTDCTENDNISTGQKNQNKNSAEKSRGGKR